MKRLLLTTFVLFAALRLLAQSTLPPAPTNLNAEIVPSLVPAVVRLTWDAETGPWGFRIYRSAGDTLHFRSVAVVNGKIFYDNLHAPQGMYFWFVTAVTISPDSHALESPRSNLARWNFGATPPPPTKGIIAGHVADDSTGKPISGVAIRFFRNGPTITLWPPPTAYTDKNGNYVALLDTGTYFVRADPAPYMPPGPPAYRSEWFDNVQEMSKATPVPVYNRDTAHADFGLSWMQPPVRPRGTISGTVIDDLTQKPIPMTWIRFYARNATTANILPTVTTDSNGNYQAELDTGIYLVRAETPPLMNPWSKTYRPEWFDNVTDVSQATPVAVRSGSNFKANFGLLPLEPPTPCFVEGRVTDTLGTPLKRAQVVIMKPILTVMNDPSVLFGVDGGESMEIEGVGTCRGVVWRGQTDSVGRYRAQLPGPAKYIAMASKFGYLPEYYNNRSNPIQADIFAVTGTVKGIDFSLAFNPDLRNSISGVVQDSLGTGVSSRIILFPAGPLPLIFRHIRFGHTDSTGAYTLSDVWADKYFVLALPFRGYAPAFYKAGAYGVLNWQKADPVNVSGDVAGINIGVVRLHCTGVTVLAGRVTAAGGGGISGVRVFASNAGGDLVGFGLTDPAGAYTVEGLPPGTVTLVYDCEGYQFATRYQTIQPNAFSVENVNQTLQTVVTEVEDGAAAPLGFRMEQNYPNPFNPTTVVSYQLSVASDVKLIVYDMLGREVSVLVNERRNAGTHRVQFDASGLSSGVYVCRLVAGSFTRSIKLTLVR